MLGGGPLGGGGGGSVGGTTVPIGKSLANFVTFTQPEAIILTGGLVHSGDWILEPTKIAFNKNLLPFYKNKVKILLSGLEDKDSAILGSAALVWKNIL